jgi:hypothetical protein
MPVGAVEVEDHSVLVSLKQILARLLSIFHVEWPLEGGLHQVVT